MLAPLAQDMSGIRDLLLPLARTRDATHQPCHVATATPAQPDPSELVPEAAGQAGARGVQAAGEEAGECEGLGRALSHMGLVMDGKLVCLQEETRGE